MNMKEFPTSTKGEWLRTITNVLIPIVMVGVFGWVWAIDRQVAVISSTRYTDGDARTFAMAMAEVHTAQLEALAGLARGQEANHDALDSLREDIREIRNRLDNARP
jgi:hypothetical protein